ncbi:MAG: hypothetical protein Q7U13_13205 [Rhodoferax sp.]|nr:hypothetical protein [Rhodoferax sp.]
MVGGDYHGDNTAIQNAKRTYVGVDTQLKADAIDSGNGGKVIVWSDDTTRVYGSITARGGAQGGNGGFVEMSGKQNLDFHAKVDASAKAGNNGTLLLDPTSITITGNSGEGGSDGTTTFQGASTPGTANFTDAGPTIIYQSEIEGMAAGTNLVLEAADYIGTSGAFVAGVVTLANNSNLTLRTRNASGDGASMIGINLVASSDGANLTFKTQGTGTIAMQTGTGASPRSADIQVGKLVTDGGQVALSGTGNVVVGDITTTPSGAGIGGDVAITSSMGSITVNRNMDARGNGIGAGNVTLNAAGAIGVHNSALENYPIYANQLTMTANGGISDGSSGPVITQVSSLTATNSGSGTVNISNIGGLSIVGTGVVQTGGDINLSANGDINVAAAINAGTRNVTLHARDTAGITQGGGTITASSLTATAADGIGHGIALITRIGALTANNSGANTDINIVNTGVLTLNDIRQTADGSTGNINISNTGALTAASSTAISAGTGSITLTAHSPLSINGTVQSTGGGNINLTAGATGSTADKLTVTGTGSVSTAGTVTLKAGDAIYTLGSVSGGTVTQTPYMNGPAPSSCALNPTGPGCASTILTAQVVAQAFNSTINLLNVLAAPPPPLQSSPGKAVSASNTGDPKQDANVAQTTGDSGAKNDATKNEISKAFCN